MPYVSDTLPPGICDFHVHVGERIGGYVLRDDFKALNLIAKRHGIIGIGAFVTEEEGITLTDKYHRMRKRAQADFEGHVHWHLTPVKAHPDEIIPLFKDGCDIKLYTTYLPAGLYSSYETIERWMTDLADIKPKMLVHSEDDGIVADASSKHPFRHPFDHSLRRPEIAEILAVEKVLNLALKHSYPVHIVHVSTPRAAQLIAEAKKHLPTITCETAPHYLIYNEELLKSENAHRWLCSPPFRKEASRGQLVELMQDGVFDIIATDHCPFTDADKDRFKDEPEKVPCGIPGLETLFSSMYEHFVRSGKISGEHLVSMTMHKPAELMGITDLCHSRRHSSLEGWNPAP
ncbi:MAG: dihydroorotase family protein [Candidatus Cloacimonadaceae bacterium]|nr:dihydroorotase family protein [Candidatus Cloacimonadaceae bacterium]